MERIEILSNLVNNIGNKALGQVIVVKSIWYNSKSKCYETYYNILNIFNKLINSNTYFRLGAPLILERDC